MAKGCADSIGASAVEMDEMLVGLGDVDEESCEELERIGQGVVELGCGFRLVDEQVGAAVLRYAALQGNWRPEKGQTT